MSKKKKRKFNQINKLSLMSGPAHFLTSSPVTQELDRTSMDEISSKLAKDVSGKKDVSEGAEVLSEAIRRFQGTNDADGWEELERTVLGCDKEDILSYWASHEDKLMGNYSAQVVEDASRVINLPVGRNAELKARHGQHRSDLKHRTLARLLLTKIWLSMGLPIEVLPIPSRISVTEIGNSNATVYVENVAMHRLDKRAAKNLSGLILAKQKKIEVMLLKDIGGEISALREGNDRSEAALKNLETGVMQMLDYSNGSNVSQLWHGTYLATRLDHYVDILNKDGFHIYYHMLLLDLRKPDLGDFKRVYLHLRLIDELTDTKKKWVTSNYSIGFKQKLMSKFKHVKGFDGTIDAFKYRFSEDTKM
jgi:hypothetical protein